MAIRILAGYPSPNDSGKFDVLFDIDGPASYVNTGTFLTSGQQVTAAQLGMGGIEDIGADMLASDNTSVVEVSPFQNISAGTGAPAAGPAQSPAPVMTRVALHWFQGVTRATEYANTTNLSGKYIRLRAVCI